MYVRVRTIEDGVKVRGILYNVFINGRPTMFCLAILSERVMILHNQALQNMLSWEVSVF